MSADREIGTDNLFADLGCSPDCVVAGQVREALLGTVEDHPDNLGAAVETASESADYLKERPCDFVKTGQCRLAELLARTNMAQRIILDMHDIKPTGDI